MKKKVGILVLATALVFGGTSLQVLANGKGNAKATEKFEHLTDGRNANGIETGVILDIVKTEGTFYEGDTFQIFDANIVIDGPSDTLKWFVNGEKYEFGDELTLKVGSNNFQMTAETHFKNGQKDGLVHSSSVAYNFTITALARPNVDLVARSLSSEWNSDNNAKNTVRVQYTITIGETTFNDFTNFNGKDRDRGHKIITIDGVTFKVNYLDPSEN